MAFGMNSRWQKIRAALALSTALLLFSSPLILNAIHFAKFKSEARKTVSEYVKVHYGWREHFIGFGNNSDTRVSVHQSSGGYWVVDSMSLDIHLSADGREITHVEEMMNP